MYLQLQLVTFTSKLQTKTLVQTPCSFICRQTNKLPSA
ncbi:hypothetical protein M3J09_004895 [Ascochyta lentis]